MTQPLTLRPDLKAPDAPESVEVIQLTHGTLPSCHVYMEAQIFTPDSRRFILHESAAAHSGDKTDPRHRYLLCDLDDHARLHPITHEQGATAPSVSPSGKSLYYFVDETEVNGGRLSLKRVDLDGSNRQTLLVVDGPLPGVPYRPSRIYPLSTIRADESKIALSCFLGNGQTEEAPWGLLVFDQQRAAVDLVISGPSWCNMHPQYSREASGDGMQDILIQENHGNSCSPSGEIRGLVGGAGADVHVIRDDGSNFRDLPWGRDGNEFCQGHQCWRGVSPWAITSTHTLNPPEQQLIESLPVPSAGHIGRRAPVAVRNDLSRRFPQPHFYHFATDRDGRRLVTDAGPGGVNGRLFIAAIGRPGQDPLSAWTCLAHPRCSWGKNAHLHPFLSPDGRAAFFNSDESGVLHAYMVRGLPPI